MTEAEDNRPEWMIELENRKRKPRLAHEAGAGSPCLSCKEACPGLDLHFWRKICKNCKCGRDEHDVVDDDFPQFDLLLGPSGKPRRKATFLPVAIKKQPDKENAFEWIPPDVTTEIAADYMKALPENKLPIQGSVGAALRKQQLQKQLPLHDMDHKACDKLSEDEKQQFEKYLENLKKYVGQGRVSKVMGARPFNKSLMTPANAADMQPMSPQRKPQVYVSTNDSSNLRTPSSFISKVQGLPNLQGSQKQQAWLAANIKAIQAQISENAVSTAIHLGQYHPALDNISNTGQIVNSEVVNSNRHPAQQFANMSHITDNQQNKVLTLKNPENVQYIPNFGKVHFQTEYSQIGEQFVPSTSPKKILPHDNSNIKNNARLDKSLHVPNQQIVNSSNLPTAWNASHSSPIQSGQYHNTSIPISNTLEASVKSDSPEIVKQALSGHNRHFRDHANSLHMGSASELETGASHSEKLWDHNRVPQSDTYSDDICSVNAQLAEQMLSDALLPPSAVHANEIIGSTLDRNKLKYIQEQLSAKYSKDDSPSQHILKSQRIDELHPHFGQDIAKHKNPQMQDPLLDKEAQRIALIAAMRNPSGFLADNQILEKTGPQYANALEQVGQNKYTSSTASMNEVSGVPMRIPNANLILNTDSTVPKESWQGSNLVPSDSIVPLDIEHGMPMDNQFVHQPMSHQYPGALSSSKNLLSAIPDQQQYSLKANHQLPPDSAKLDQYLRPLHGSSAYQGTLGFDNDKSLGNPSSLSNTERLQAELSHQPIDSHVIHSESLGNPVFPEGIIDSPALRQNPASVDQLRGALEELSIGSIQLQKCTQCEEEIHSGDIVVTAERAKDAVWHPGCFICSTCNELLVDLVYFYHKGKLYCGRDLATLLNIPRCFACDELIFVREYTVAEGHNYHVKHFCCWDCDMPLAGQQYISENDRPLCLPCYQKTYAKTCQTCNKVIAADQQGVAVKNLDFHANDTCFSCFTCKKSLLSGRMAIKEDRPFCSKECITEFMNNKA
ncbi:uncharacterized protein LOC107224724 [Neodiprion lecontei]|uniref:Uncharacterized protein LOC107224724 n=1 Tax=Neodiprion lecontei TaxID=441921 RepID=A0A6J0C1I0_NEOLC|nr:uncharacterized protein LOC107224724 [Neodiprion lecontei]